MASSRICSVEDCEKSVWAKGLCNTHYARARKGIPLDAPSPTKRGEATAYLIASLLIQTRDCIPWPYAKISGYAYVSDPFKRARSISVGRRICEIVYGPAPFPDAEAAHSCGKGHLGCINHQHLRWATPLENAADRKLHGTIGPGEKSYRAKLTSVQVAALRKKAAELGYPKRGAGTILANEFGVSRSNVHWIVHRTTWWKD